MNSNNKANRLLGEKSPYLLQHAYNPVEWYPWGQEAFEKAKAEDKPVFLSIGYSTCHWCHVMAHESFEDSSVADYLNRHFVSIKVDKEERPDIDGVYMRVCQAMTGGGGWPTSIFVTGEGKPFYAGTYFPKAGFLSLLSAIENAWRKNRAELLLNGDQIAEAISEAKPRPVGTENAQIKEAITMFRKTFDKEYGGFGSAPKFPSPHNLLFLLFTAPDMARKTLLQMYKGGIFDQIGGGFSRYSTDRYWLAPHFEKMLYDNALLAMSYLTAFETTGEELYRDIADRIFTYLEREMKSPEGGFYSAQDADSDGVEGKYYLFVPDELRKLLGSENGERFCRAYDITPNGNFEGKNIPNLLHTQSPDGSVEALLPKVYEYRKSRTQLHTDTKLLTAWNSLTAAAYAMAARILKSERYMAAVRDILRFIEQELTEGSTVFVGKSGGVRSGPGFLDDYAFYIFALLQMHQATLEDAYITRAAEITEKTISDFWDEEHGGFFFSGGDNETLISRPKETWDGAIPSGNSVMAYCLSRLSRLTENERLQEISDRQNDFMNGQAADYPAGYGFYLYSSLPVKSIVIAVNSREDLKALQIKSNWIVRVDNTPAYPLKEGRTTYYVCEDNACRPPTNDLPI